MKTIFFGLLALCAGLASSAQTVYGALAIDKSRGFYYGWAQDYASATGAENRALKECRDRGGNCSVVLLWEGVGCGVYRTLPGSGTAYGWGIAPTQTEADAIASTELRKRANGQTGSNYVWACNTVGRFKVLKNELDPPKPDSTTRIGSQVWTSLNLAVTRFRNGDSIRETHNWTEWIAAWKNGQPAFMRATAIRQAGFVYNVHALSDPRGLAPKGWHLPSVGEWQQLIDFLGGKYAAFTKLKSPEGWTLRNGDRSTSFLALPTGYYGGSAFKRDYFVNWWTTTVDGKYQVTIHAAEYESGDQIAPGTQTSAGCFIRLVKDRTP